MKVSTISDIPNKKDLDIQKPFLKKKIFLTSNLLSTQNIKPKIRV